MAYLKSIHVFVIPVQVHGNYFTAVQTANIGSFADPGHKTALYGSSIKFLSTIITISGARNCLYGSVSGSNIFFQNSSQ